MDRTFRARTNRYIFRGKFGGEVLSATESVQEKERVNACVQTDKDEVKT
jgi:hypothetical protein